jgi:hypothetical protein
MESTPGRNLIELPYVVSPQDINLIITNRTEYLTVLSKKMNSTSWIDIENVQSMKALRLLVEILCNAIELQLVKTPIKMTFHKNILKKMLDIVLKKHYVRSHYEGIVGRMRIYKIYG